MLWSRSGGRDDGPLLVLLHGLGATAEVWRGVEALLPETWSGGWVAYDLPGHGRSDRADDYRLPTTAGRLVGQLPHDRDLVLMGHSMGGMIALLAAADLPRVRRVVGFSIKTWWPPDHVEGMRSQAFREQVTFDDRGQALARHARVAGLVDLVAADDPSLEPGVEEVEGGWRLAQDPRTNDFGEPRVSAAVAAVDVPVTLARGSEDPFVREDNLRELVDDPVTFEGLGHNPHVEDPGSVVSLLR